MSIRKVYKVAAKGIEMGKRLDRIANDFIAEYNFERHMTKHEGRLLSVLGDQLGRPIGFWKEHPCHGLYFMCNSLGVLKRFGSRQEFSEKEIEKYYVGRFKVAVALTHIHAARLAGITGIDFPHERIVSVKFYKKEVPGRIMERITITGKYYNGEFGFNPDYNGFTAGNFLDEGEFL